jgi:hypothetical protein
MLDVLFPSAALVFLFCVLEAELNGQRLLCPVASSWVWLVGALEDSRGTKESEVGTLTPVGFSSGSALDWPL